MHVPSTNEQANGKITSGPHTGQKLPSRVMYGHSGNQPSLLCCELSEPCSCCCCLLLLATDTRTDRFLSAHQLTGSHTDSLLLLPSFLLRFSVRQFAQYTMIQSSAALSGSLHAKGNEGTGNATQDQPH